MSRARGPWPRRLAAALALAALAGCSAARPPEVDPAARAQALVDAGNRAYGAGDYGLAARRYAAAVVVREDDAAAYFGLGMALAKLGRDEEARVAYAKARELARLQRAAPPARTGAEAGRTIAP